MFLLKAPTTWQFLLVISISSTRKYQVNYSWFPRLSYLQLFRVLDWWLWINLMFLLKTPTTWHLFILWLQYLQKGNVCRFPCLSYSKVSPFRLRLMAVDNFDVPLANSFNPTPPFTARDFNSLKKTGTSTPFLSLSLPFNSTAPRSPCPGLMVFDNVDVPLANSNNFP